MCAKLDTNLKLRVSQRQYNSRQYTTCMIDRVFCVHGYLPLLEPNQV